MDADELELEEAPRQSEAATNAERRTDGPFSMDTLEKWAFAEYESPSGDKWRVERGPDLARDFELADLAHLTRWHSALCGQDPAWTIICRIYGNAPLYGVEELDELRVWTIAELAEKRGVEPREIDSYLQGARTYWKRWQLEEERGDANADATFQNKPKPAVDDEAAAQLLLDHGFGSIEDQEERAYLAQRIVELKGYLESDTLRSAARNVIQQEVTIFFVLDPTIRDYRTQIARKTDNKNSTEKENSQLMLAMRERRDAQTALEASMKMLGLTDGQGGGLRKKIAFVDSWSTAIVAYQKYHSENDRGLIDDVFTAAEVELLTTPTQLRPAQYRPDLILSIHEAKQHLWEHDWSPTPMSRRACRKLRAGFNHGLAEARSQEGEVVDDEAAEEELLADVSQRETGIAPFEAGGISTHNLPVPTGLPRASTADETAVMIT